MLVTGMFSPEDCSDASDWNGFHQKIVVMQVIGMVFTKCL